jgi:hypothetical protein
VGVTGGTDRVQRPVATTATTTTTERTLAEAERLATDPAHENESTQGILAGIRARATS